MSKVCILPGLDTTGLAASLTALPVGLAWHGTIREHFVEKEMSLITGGEQANVVRVEDLKYKKMCGQCVTADCNGERANDLAEITTRRGSPASTLQTMKVL
jgi:hypothetical protein